MHHHAVTYKDTFRTLVGNGVPPERARRVLNHAFIRVRRRGYTSGLGDEITGDVSADPAGQSWLDRTTAIVAEYKDPAYSKADLHLEAQNAMQGISALLQNRFSQLSSQMVQWLYAADDTLNKVQVGTLSATFESPWAAGATEFFQTLKQEVVAGGKALVNPLSVVPWWAWPLGGLVGLAAAKSLLKF